MEDFSYGLFTIFIAFIIFSVIKNVFFNVNQFSWKIRRKYLSISLSYFAIFFIGIASVILASKNVEYIVLDLSFLFASLSMIFTTIRMDANDTSAYNKWYYSKAIKDEKYIGESSETKPIIYFYIFCLILDIIPVAWVGFFISGDLKLMICTMLFIIISFIFVICVFALNGFVLGKLRRDNLLYNYLWDKLQNGNNLKNKEIIEDKARELFKKLFNGKKYIKNSAMNDQILKWIGESK